MSSRFPTDPRTGKPKAAPHVLRRDQKQFTTHETLLGKYRDAMSRIPRSTVDEQIGKAVDRIDLFRRETGLSLAYGWSGGKDSVALDYVAKAAGIEESVFCMTDGLEYPAFLAWVTDHMPLGLTVLRNDWNLEWLARHQDWLYPQDSATAARWYAGTQWALQAEYMKQSGVGALVLGRRREDGNSIPANGRSEKKDGTVKFSPLHDWSHNLVFALLGHYGADLPPIYDWPRGFRVGTGAWPARRWCDGIVGGWRENWTIDPSLVRAAAPLIPSAAQFMRENGLV